MSRTGFSATETRAVVSIASLYTVRMLGLFMLLPVLSLYARDLGASPFMTGIAVGIYGLTQAVLQIPFGIFSDRFGRKPLIMIGLVVFLIGSLVAAEANGIYGIIIGRAIQGAGAIPSVLMALLGDLTREQNRSKAMAAVGASIGMSFALALVIGPWISGIAGLQGLFLFTALLATVALFLTVYVVPTPMVSRQALQRAPAGQVLREVLRDAQLLRLDAGVFALHFIMTASFIAVPLVLQDSLGIARASHGKVYLLLLVVSFIAMVPGLVVAERKRQVKPFFQSAVVIIAVAMACMPWAQVSLWATLASLWLYFLGFNFLEATLPSLMSRAARRDNRGTASGLYSTCQFIGAFCGGSGGGWALQVGGVSGVFALCVGVGAVWILVTLGMSGPTYLRDIELSLTTGGMSIAELSEELQQLPGVREVIILAGENTARLQVDNSQFDPHLLERLPVRYV